MKQNKLTFLFLMFVSVFTDVSSIDCEQYLKLSQKPEFSASSRILYAKFASRAEIFKEETANILLRIAQTSGHKTQDRFDAAKFLEHTLKQKYQDAYLSIAQDPTIEWVDRLYTSEKILREYPEYKQESIQLLLNITQDPKIPLHNCLKAASILIKYPECKQDGFQILFNTAQEPERDMDHRFEAIRILMFPPDFRQDAAQILFNIIHVQENKWDRFKAINILMLYSEYRQRCEEILTNIAQNSRNDICYRFEAAQTLSYYSQCREKGAQFLFGIAESSCDVWYRFKSAEILMKKSYSKQTGAQAYLKIIADQTICDEDRFKAAKLLWDEKNLIAEKEIAYSIICQRLRSSWYYHSEATKTRKRWIRYISPYKK